MKFGICGGPELADCAVRAGFDFGEWSVGGLLKPRESREAFQAAFREIRGTKLPYPVINCFVPGDLKITGPDADLRQLEEYVKITMERAEEAGVEVIVFGSGGARSIPRGFDTEAAHVQLVDFCSMVGPIAEKRGVTVVVEPLSNKECNVLTTVGECAELVRKVDHPNVRLLVDSYHFLRDGDSYGDIAVNGDLFRHVHVATVPNRLPPGAEPCDLSLFFEALAKGGYHGRISIEGKVENPEKVLPVAIQYMMELA